jgi:alanine racemase
LHEKPKDAAALVLAIDLGALVSNWERLAALSAPAETSAVVKADAYGIGIEPAVRALSAAGCRTFFVAVVDEGVRLRAVLPDADIYVLAGFFPDWEEAFRRYALRPVLNTFASVEAWVRHCPSGLSALHVDTGMNRLGLTLHEALEIARRPELLARAGVRLVMSHLACADEPRHPLNAAQLALFKEVRAAFPGVLASFANSAGIHLGHDFRFDLVRAGIGLYGAEFMNDRAPLSTVVTAKARILQVREAASGETIGYGAEKHLAAGTKIAVLAAGYGDGYPRGAGSSDTRPGGSVAIRGRRAAILGRVSMDLITVDVTGIAGVSEGGFAELFGPDMPIDEVARAGGTIAYVILTNLSRRAERVYLGGRGHA